MSRTSKSLFLEEIIALLVNRFGAERVRTALSRVSVKDEEDQPKPRKVSPSSRKPSHPPVIGALEEIRESEPEKYRLLKEFLDHLKSRKVLPESQDIRHFAQLIGLKNIAGKSRKDMIPTLMRFLLEQPSERLRVELQSAETISEQQRQQGFSVLTDKLLGESNAVSPHGSSGRVN